nr:MAG TPA: hypothetical protein [Bacteriophage sp.]
MSNRYECPYAVRKPQLDFLLCKLLMKDGVNYFNVREGVTAMCAHQRHCNCTKRVENTEGAQSCYQYHSEQKSD